MTLPSLRLKANADRRLRAGAKLLLDLVPLRYILECAVHNGGHALLEIPLKAGRGGRAVGRRSQAALTVGG